MAIADAYPISNLEKPYKKKLIKRRKPNRSIVGDFFIYLALALIAAAMAFPLVFAISSSLKPLDELFLLFPTVSGLPCYIKSLLKTT